MVSKEEDKKFYKKLIGHFFEPLAYEDYDFSENDGEVDHEGLICTLCPTIYEGEMETFKNMLEHLYQEHFQEVKELEKSSPKAPGGEK